MRKLSFTLLLPCFPLLCQTAGLTVQGTVLNASSARSVNGAIVTATKRGLPPLSQTAKSALDGSFQIESLTPGTYTLCVQVPGGGYLNPCIWATNPPTVSLTSGKPASGVQLKIEAGSILSVRINDAANVLSLLGKSGQAPPVSMGVHTPAGLFEPLTMRTVDVTGSEHEVTIPFDNAVPVWVHSGKLALTEVDGTAVPAGGLSLSVTHSSAASVSAPQLVFQITGIKP